MKSWLFLLNKVAYILGYMLYKVSFHNLPSFILCLKHDYDLLENKKYNSAVTATLRKPMSLTNTIISHSCYLWMRLLPSGFSQVGSKATGKQTGCHFTDDIFKFIFFNSNFCIVFMQPTQCNVVVDWGILVSPCPPVSLYVPSVDGLISAQ